MTDRTAKSPSKSRASGATAPARRISFAALDLEALERDLDASPGRRAAGVSSGGKTKTDGPSAPAAAAKPVAAANPTVRAGAGKSPAPARPRGGSGKTRAGVAKAVPTAAEAVGFPAEPAPAAPVAAAAATPAAEVSAALADADATPRHEEAPDPFEVVARQARLLLRLSAATEGLEARYRELAERRRGDDALLEEAREEARQARQQARRLALENVRLMDALDWVYEALAHRGDPLAAQVASARRDCLRHLAAVGITEVPADGLMDGRLHEGLESVSGGEVPRYHIVSVVRRGYQMGADVLRRTEVTTAE